MKTRKTDRVISKVLLMGFLGLSFTAFAGAGGDFLSKLMSEGKAMVEGTFQSDGSKVYSTGPLFSITPPQGWAVTHGPGGNSPTLIMQEPEQKFVKGSKDPIFRRNITVSLIQQSAPIDDVRLKSFKEDLEKKFGNNSLTRNFQVIETRFGNWKGTKDAIIAYAGWLAGDIQMMQMHILVSGNDHQYMMSYTDMASRFLPESEQMTAAWNTMMSLDLDGAAPSRYTSVIIGGSIALSILGLLMFSRSLRRRRHYQLLSDEGFEGEVSKSEFQSQMSYQFVVKKPTPVNDRLPEFDPISIPNSNPLSAIPVRILKNSREEKLVKPSIRALKSSMHSEMHSDIHSDMHSEFKSKIAVSAHQMEKPVKTKLKSKAFTDISSEKRSDFRASESASVASTPIREQVELRTSPSPKATNNAMKKADLNKSQIGALSEVPKLSSCKKIDQKKDCSVLEDSTTELDKRLAKSSPMDSMIMESWPMSVGK